MGSFAGSAGAPVEGANPVLAPTIIAEAQEPKLVGVDVEATLENMFTYLLSLVVNMRVRKLEINFSFFQLIYFI